MICDVDLSFDLAKSHPPSSLASRTAVSHSVRPCASFCRRNRPIPSPIFPASRTSTRPPWTRGGSLRSASCCRRAATSSLCASNSSIVGSGGARLHAVSSSDAVVAPLLLRVGVLATLEQARPQRHRSGGGCAGHRTRRGVTTAQLALDALLALAPTGGPSGAAALARRASRARAPTSTSFCSGPPRGDAVLLVEGRIYRNSHGVPTGTVNGPFSRSTPTGSSWWPTGGSGTATAPPRAARPGGAPRPSWWARCQTCSPRARVCARPRHSTRTRAAAGRWSSRSRSAWTPRAPPSSSMVPSFPGHPVPGLAFVAQTHVNNETRWSTPSSDLLEAMQFRDEMLQQAKVEREALRSQKAALRHGRSASENSKIALERIQKRRDLPKGVLRTDSTQVSRAVVRARQDHHRAGARAPRRGRGRPRRPAPRELRQRRRVGVLAMQATLRPPTPLALVNA